MLDAYQIKWMAFAPSICAHKKQIAEHSSLRNVFNSNAPTVNVYK